MMHFHSVPGHSIQEGLQQLRHRLESVTHKGFQHFKDLALFCAVVMALSFVIDKELARVPVWLLAFGACGYIIAASIMMWLRDQKAQHDYKHIMKRLSIGGLVAIVAVNAIPTSQLHGQPSVLTVAIVVLAFVVYPWICAATGSTFLWNLSKNEPTVKV